MQKNSSKIIILILIPVMTIIWLRYTFSILSASQQTDTAVITPQKSIQSTNSPAPYPIISDTIDQNRPEIYGTCLAYRGENGNGVYLYNLATNETITITDKPEPDGARKAVISDGIIVWRSDRTGENGLWGYYHPDCSETNILGSEIITPFHILDRGMSHAPALSSEMLTYMAFAPVGYWYIALIELDANDNSIPDALEPGYDPAADDIWIQLSCCATGQGYEQVLPDIYWDNDFGIVCWSANNGGSDHVDCYDLRHDGDNDSIPDWKDDDFGPPWQGQFQVITNTVLNFDWKGIISLHRDLLAWTDDREDTLSGRDIRIYDLDVDNDGLLNFYDGDFDPITQQAEFTLVNRPYHQEYPDIWWPFVVWTDRRNGNQEDVYAYDLSLDSDGDGTPNWQDPQRFCQDPAEIPVALYSAAQSGPEVWNGTAIWIDNRTGDGDIWGADLQPVLPLTRTAYPGTSQEKAVHWLEQQTVHFPAVEDIPGYISASGMITRYKSFIISGTDSVEVRQAWYKAEPGSYVDGFDYCYFGTPDQKRYLGRFGRGFTYDQALGLIVHTMLSQTMQAEELGRYVSTFQNSGQLTTTTPGSFGFSFNGQGYWGEKDNFYDMDYLRGGANGWLGYGYLFYGRQYNDAQFMDVMTSTGEYLLTLQYLDDESDNRYGLFQGGYGRWSDDTFVDENEPWVATEHNIDIYFFLRDLGRETGNNAYSNAAELQKENMRSLWNKDKGRFNQGIDNDGDALDAASWGSMYLIATGDIISAIQSLQFADQNYFNTVTVSDTIMSSPEITISGYKPYTGTAEDKNWSSLELVWSEGSLGVAMAKLKLGHALLDQCNNPLGHMYIQQAEDIVAEMDTLQSLDPEGGLFYAAYPGEEIADFPRAPSMAGTAWLLMTQQAMTDGTWRDAFWSADTNVTWVCPPQAYLPVISNGP